MEDLWGGGHRRREQRREDRQENIRRAAEVSALFAQAGLIAMAAEGRFVRYRAQFPAMLATMTRR